MTLAFLPRQPAQSQEFSLSIDPDLVTQMNAWRLQQNPVQGPNEAIVSLIRLGLAAQKSPAPADISDDSQVVALASQFRDIIAGQR